MSRRLKIMSGLATLLAGVMCQFGGCGFNLPGSGPMRWVLAILNEELWG